MEFEIARSEALVAFSRKDKPWGFHVPGVLSFLFEPTVSVMRFLFGFAYSLTLLTLLRQ